MEYLFYNCKSLQSLDISNFNTENVKNFGLIFFECNSLTLLYLPKIYILLEIIQNWKLFV